MPSGTISPFSRLLRRTVATFLVAGVSGLAAYGLYSWHQVQREVQQNFAVLSTFLASTTESFFDSLANGLEPLGQLLDRMDVLAHSEDTREVLLRFQARFPDIGSMAVLRPDGVMVINTASPAGEPLPDFRNDPPYLEKLLQAIRDPGRYVIGRPEYGKVLGQWRFPFRHVVHDSQGQPKFVLQAAIPLERGRTFLHRLPVPTNTFFGILREDGYQQARWPTPDPARVYTRFSTGPVAKIVQADPTVREGTFTGVSPWQRSDGKRVGAFTRLPTTNMYAYVSVPAGYLAERWWRLNAPVFASFCLFIVVFSLLAYRVAQRERSHSRELLDQAKQDALTALPNRAAAEDVLLAESQLAKAAGQQFAVMFLDLDRFKDINDTLGHAAGDQLLVAVSKALRSCLREADILTRFGGDEFLIILPGANQAGAARAAEHVLSAFSDPVTFGGHELQITPSLGIAIYPDHGSDVDTLVKHADTAMYESKRRGRNGYSFYAEDLSEAVHHRIALESQLRGALEQGRFTLVYQPIIDIQSRRIVGAEALVRWMDDRGNMRSPGEFITVAEESGLIIPLGDWVLRTACQQAKRWTRHDIWVAVNLSTRQFQDPRLADKVAGTLRETGLEACHLELEITESAAMLDPEASITVLGQLKDLGVQIAIDDFGTGYSSLSYLKRIPADKIKIDKSFIDGVTDEIDDGAIVRTIIALAGTLDQKTVAEGIEAGEQFDTVRALGCNQAQGYWISRPVSAAEFQKLLDNGVISPHPDGKHSSLPANSH